jgi:hypothetical protein
VRRELPLKKVAIVASQPRVYLFHGTDSRASSLALRRWESLFREKYGETTRYLISVDELNPDQLARSLGEVVDGVSLFPEPKLIIIKRVTNNEKGKVTPFSKVLTAFLDSRIKKMGGEITLAIWEEKQLVENSILLTWFTKHVESKLASATLYSVPHWREVRTVAQKYLAAHEFTLSNEGERWLVARYQEQEKHARLAKRLKSTDLLLEDERSWWLYQLLDSAMLRATTSQVRQADLEAGATDLVEGVSVFEIVNAITTDGWKQARRLLRLWESALTDDSNYFGLYALLRMHFGRRNQAYEMLLMAELEVIVKNYTLPHAWLVDLLVSRLEERAKTKKEESLLPARTLWLAQLHRSS